MGDRHNGEIAAYHIGRILDFRRGAHAVGRFIDVDREILPVATKQLKQSMSLDGEGNRCFTRDCYRCSPKRNITVCADAARLEGSVTLWLPSDLKETFNPLLRQAYRKHIGEMDAKYCNKTAFLKEKYRDNPTLLMDLIDAVILDFLIVNADRHTQYQLSLGNDSMIVMLDNAKSFGNPYPKMDHMSILAPLYKCCRLRESTWTRMLYLQGILGDVLEAVLDQDPIAPVLAKDHFDGLNERLDTAINTVRKCINTLGETKVLLRV